MIVEILKAKARSLTRVSWRRRDWNGETPKCGWEFLMGWGSPHPNSHHYFWVSWNWSPSTYLLKTYRGSCQKAHRAGDLHLEQPSRTILGLFMEQAHSQQPPLSGPSRKVHFIWFFLCGWAERQTRKRGEMGKDWRHRPFAHVTNPGIPDQHTILLTCQKCDGREVGGSWA